MVLMVQTNEIFFVVATTFLLVYLILKKETSFD